MDVVIIGCGLIAESHAQAIVTTGQANLAGVCDLRPEAARRIAGRYAVRAFTEAACMLEALRPDAAIICVPPHAHTDCVRMCAAHGVHVLCEKPLARDWQDARELIDCVRAAGILFMTAQVVRFWPGYTELHQLHQRGELGTIHMMHLRRVASRSGPYSDWLFDPELGGGAMHDMLVHDVDYLRYLAGPFDRCYAHATKDETGCYNNVFASIVHRNGIHAVAETSFNMQAGYPFSFSFSVVGSAATIEYDYKAGATIADRSDSESTLSLWRRDTGKCAYPISVVDPYQRQLAYFLNCVRENRQPTLIKPEESLDVMAMIDALHRSADTGAVVSL